MKTNSQTDGSLLNNRLSNKNIENLMAMHIGKIITDGVRGFNTREEIHILKKITLINANYNQLAPYGRDWE